MKKLILAILLLATPCYGMTIDNPTIQKQLNCSDIVSTGTNVYISPILNASPDTDTVHSLGRVKIGGGAADAAMVSHYDLMDTDNFALFQTSFGQTAINASSGQSLLLCINGADWMNLTSTLFRSDVPVYVNSNSTTAFKVDNATANPLIYDTTNGRLGIGTVPTTALSVDSNSNTQCVRIFGADAANEIGDIYMGSNGELIIASVGNETNVIDLRPKHPTYGVLIRETDGTGTSTFANIGVVDAATPYTNIVTNSAYNTLGLVIDSNQLVTANANLAVKNGNTTAGTLYLYEDSDDGANYTSIKVPPLAANVNYVLPADDGNANESLTTDGAGNLSWAAGSSSTELVMDSTPNTDHSYSGVSSTGTAGQNIVFGDLCFMCPSGRYYKCNGDNSASMPCTVLALETINAGNSGKLLHQGYVRDDSYALATGSIIYATSGIVTVTQPSAADSIIQTVGYATGNNYFYFNPSTDWMTHI